MPTLVAMGQITIVDNNDARPLTAYITSAPGPQQVFSKDESLISYNPDWTTVNSNTGNQLVAKVFAGAVGTAVDVTGQLTNRKFTMTVGGAAITGTNALISSDSGMAANFVSGAGLTYTVVHNTAGSTFNIKSNMLDSVSQDVIYFEGDYTDPITGLTSHIIAQITLSMVKTGTNAVFIQLRGQSAIEQATGSTKTIVVQAADLIRASGIDTSGVTYRFYESNGATQIINTGSFNTKYGTKTIAPGGALTGVQGDIGSGLPASGAWGAGNALVIHETAIQDMGVFRVEAKDSDNTIYQQYFTVYDVTDPYEVRVNSSAGDKLQNGVGSSILTPDVYYGAQRVASLTGWTFNWTIYNKDGKRGAFIDTTRTAVAGGRTITAHTSGNSAVFTYDGASITFAAGNIIKCVTPSGDARFFEVASGTGNTVTIRVGTTNNFLNFTDFPAPTDTTAFVNGKLYVCVGNLGQQVSNAGAGITITGDEVDAKARFTVEANRP